MIDNNRVIALILARGGSKRLPRKNILLLKDKPLIAWTIESAQKSKFVDRVIVNSDDDEIIAIAQKYNAEVPYKRPAELATDTTTSSEVILHAISELKLSQDKTIIILLQPTSPFRTSQDIDEVLSLLVNNNADGVVSVCKCSHSPIWSNTLPKNLSMGSFIQEQYQNKRGQDLPIYYRLNGSIYAYTVTSIIRNRGVFYSDKVYGYVMEESRSIDIDNLFDFEFAEFLMSKMSNF